MNNNNNNNSNNNIINNNNSNNNNNNNNINIRPNEFKSKPKYRTVSTDGTLNNITNVFYLHPYYYLKIFSFCCFSITLDIDVSSILTAGT